MKDMFGTAVRRGDYLVASRTVSGVPVMELSRVASVSEEGLVVDAVVHQDRADPRGSDFRVLTRKYDRGWCSRIVVLQVDDVPFKYTKWLGET